MKSSQYSSCTLCVTQWAAADRLCVVYYKLYRSVTKLGVCFTWLYCIYNLPSCFSLLPMWSVMQMGNCSVYEIHWQTPKPKLITSKWLTWYHLCTPFSAIGTPDEKCFHKTQHTGWMPGKSCSHTNVPLQLYYPSAFGVINLLWNA